MAVIFRNEPSWIVQNRAVRWVFGNDGRSHSRNPRLHTRRPAGHAYRGWHWHPTMTFKAQVNMARLVRRTAKRDMRIINRLGSS